MEEFKFLIKQFCVNLSEFTKKFLLIAAYMYCINSTSKKNL